jgi:phosphatidylethanolamine/phosphatidyl-N-methylethanolamine N-methyltransferase
MEIEAVRQSYARWAPVYDYTFGAVTSVGRRRAVQYLSKLGGDVLEVGVGTGLALPYYGKNVTVTGIDYSAEMLEKAREKVSEKGLTQVRSLLRMDARSLDFPDNHFDAVAAMHIVSVVPDPERVVAEMARVCKPGGRVVIVNHFAREKGILALIERLSARFPNTLGWHSDFEKSRVLGVPGLRILKERNLPPLGLMTLLVLHKQR